MIGVIDNENAFFGVIDNGNAFFCVIDNENALLGVIDNGNALFDVTDYKMHCLVQLITDMQCLVSDNGNALSQFCRRLPHETNKQNVSYDTYERQKKKKPNDFEFVYNDCTSKYNVSFLKSYCVFLLHYFLSKYSLKY